MFYYVGPMEDCPVPNPPGCDPCAPAGECQVTEMPEDHCWQVIFLVFPFCPEQTH